MTYPFSFEVIYYDREKNEYYKQCGMGICDSFGDAANQIDRSFEDDLVKINLIKLYEENELIFLPKNAIQKYDNVDSPIIDFEIPVDKNEGKI